MSPPRRPAAVGFAGAMLAGALLAAAGSAGARDAAHPGGAASQAAAPPATLLYQNFPNPFPTTTSATTCLWFDLAEPGPTALDVYDLRGNRVRRIFPGPGEDAHLAAGRYGRGTGGSGCDGRFTWDGAGEDGRRVPSGVYLLRLHTRGAGQHRKILFTDG